MLTRVEIEGYKSLKKIDLDMTGLTVLLGPNAGGKSNFLDIFTLMAEAAIGSLSEGIARRGGMGTILFREKSKNLSFLYEFDDGFGDQQGFTYILNLDQVSSFPRIVNESLISMASGDGIYLVRGSDNKISFANKASDEERREEKRVESEAELAIFQVKDQTAYPIPYRLLRQFQDWTTYVQIEVGPMSAMRLPQTIRTGTRLFPNGSNLVAVLHAIQNEAPIIWDEIKEILHSIYPDFRHITFPAEGGDGKIMLRWWEHPFEREYGFSTNLLSDGTLHLLSLLAILKSPNPPPLICIDEPELGLHPDWIKLVAELLEEATERTQIIVATHSPILVSNVKPEHVVVVEKENGVTTMTRLSQQELTDWLDEFSLGDLWLAGHLGGRP